MTEKEFEQLIERYTAYVVAVISKVAGGKLGEEDIEEIASDVFAKLWKKRNELTIEEGKEKAYIGASARNHTLNVLKKKGLLQLIPLEEDVMAGETDSPEAELLQQEEKDMIREVVESLPEPDHEIFIRRYFYYEKVIDIARTLGIKEQTVTNKLHRGKAKLMKLFKERGIEE